MIVIFNIFIMPCNATNTVYHVGLAHVFLIVTFNTVTSLLRPTRSYLVFPTIIRFFNFHLLRCFVCTRSYVCKTHAYVNYAISLTALLQFLSVDSLCRHLFSILYYLVFPQDTPLALRTCLSFNTILLVILVRKFSGFQLTY